MCNVSFGIDGSNFVTARLLFRIIYSFNNTIWVDLGLLLLYDKYSNSYFLYDNCMNLIEVFMRCEKLRGLCPAEDCDKLVM